MFSNSSHIDASHSTFSEVHRDQYFTSRAYVQGNQTVNTIVHGNQILQRGQTGQCAWRFLNRPICRIRVELEALQKASAASAAFDSLEQHPAPRCLAGTQVRLLDYLTRWLDGGSDNNKFTCWVHGRPGSGNWQCLKRSQRTMPCRCVWQPASFCGTMSNDAQLVTFLSHARDLVSALHPRDSSSYSCCLGRALHAPFQGTPRADAKLLLEPLSSGLKNLNHRFWS